MGRVFALLVPALAVTLACRRSEPPVEPTDASTDASTEPGTDASAEPGAEPVRTDAGLPALAPIEREIAGDRNDEIICRHVGQILDRESGEAPATIEQFNQFVAECMASLDHERTTLGQAEFERQARCMLEATTSEAIDRCADADADDGDRRRAICKHVMDVMIEEMGDAVTQVSAGDIEQFLAKCVTDLDEEREKIGAREFDRMADCVLAAPNIESMMACENTGSTD